MWKKIKSIFFKEVKSLTQGQEDTSEIALIKKEINDIEENLKDMEFLSSKKVAVERLSFLSNEIKRLNSLKMKVADIKVEKIQDKLGIPK